MAFNDTRRFLLRDEIGNAIVSTVFLVIAHFSLYDFAPDLFETAIFNANDDYVEYVNRYATYEEATKGHRDIVSSLSYKLSLEENPILYYPVCPQGVRIIRTPKL